jgi:4-hydroxybenzoate polyprenyltransferase
MDLSRPSPPSPAARRPQAGPRPPGVRGGTGAVVGLLHPLPSAATVLAAGGFAVLFARGDPPPDRLWLLVALMGLQQGAISLHNDWCDRVLDGLTKPWRAIPRGLVAPRLAYALSWCLAVLSLVPAWLLGPLVTALDVLALGAGFVYNAWLKRTPWSWVPFAVDFPLLPLFGAATSGVWPPLWWTVFVVGLPLILAIHLADALPDLETDAGAGVRGLAHHLGAARGRALCRAALVLAALLGAGFGWLSGHLPAGGAAAAALVLAALPTGWPRAQRVALTAGAAITALGWVATLAHLTPA